MRSMNKRPRNKNNNRRPNHGGSVINRVFDSSGPGGKVRGTPQQIIDKYQTLAEDAQLLGDRIAHESFLQFSEHYLRLLNIAQREMEDRRDAQQKQHQNNQHNNAHKNNSSVEGMGEQPSLAGSSSDDLFPGQTENVNLVQTPENSSSVPTSKPRRRRPVKVVEKNADPVSLDETIDKSAETSS